MNSKAQIIIDGANVAHWHGREKKFSCRGLLICLAYFTQRGHKHNHLFIILPQRWQTKSELGELMDGDILTELHNSGIIAYAPAGTSDDDFIIHLAQMKNALIVTNDRFNKEKDLRPDLKSFVANRLLTYTFVRDEFIPNPNPLGTENPMSLEYFLSGYHLGQQVAPQREMSNAELMNAIKNSSDTMQQPNSAKNHQSGAQNQKANKSGSNKKNQGQKKPSDGASAGKNSSKRGSNPGESKKSPQQINIPVLTTSMNAPQIGTFHPSSFQHPPPPLGQQQPRQQFNPPMQPSHRGHGEGVLASAVLSFTPKSGAIPKQASTSVSQNSTSNENIAKMKRNRSKDESSDSPNPRLVYCMGVVMEIGVNYGHLESSTVKNKIIFYKSSYKETCDDLSKRFSKGKMVAVGYPPLKPGADNTLAIEASVVCPSDELVPGFGKVTGDVKFHGFKTVPYPIHLEPHVYCPANTFTHRNLKAKDLTNENWVDFLAMPQYPLDAKRPYVSVNTILARTVGVVVKIIESTAYLWSRLAGFVAIGVSETNLSPEKFRLGIWLEFQLNAQTVQNGCFWRGSEPKLITPKVPTMFSPDGSVVLLTSLHGYAGFITQTAGTIYCNTIGRIAIEQDCLKRCQSLRMCPNLKVSVTAKFSNPANFNPVKFAWVATEVTPFLFSEPNNSDSRLMIKDLIMVVEKVHMKNGQAKFGFLKAEKFGDVFATTYDCGVTFDTWKPGDIVKGSIIAQELPQKNWCAFCVDKL